MITNNSILAGCKHSVALTRVLFRAGMCQLKIDHPLAPPELYVDDTAMFTHGSNEEAIRNMYNSICDFVTLAKHLKLKLSSKGVIVSKLPQAAKTLVKLLKQQGVNYNFQEETRDLGVTFTKSHKIPVRKTLLTKRFKDAQGPLGKIRNLARISRRARVLFSGAGFIKATWGFETSGHVHTHVE